MTKVTFIFTVRGWLTQLNDVGTNKALPITTYAIKLLLSTFSVYPQAWEKCCDYHVSSEGSEAYKELMGAEEEKGFYILYFRRWLRRFDGTWCFHLEPLLLRKKLQVCVKR
jgi:hypothetical protein